jgi:hypothetical protein
VVLHFCRCFSSELAQAGELRFTLNRAENAAFMTGTDDSVSLPVAKPAFAGYDLGTFINAGSVRDLAPADIPAITFALFLLTA